MAFDKFRKQCEELMEKELADMLEVPPKELADLALPCFSLGTNPIEIAKAKEKEAKEKLSKSPKSFSLIKEIRSAGPYLNFYINEEEFSKLVLKEIEKDDFGRGKENKKIMVEYSAPNSNKPLHVGHMRNDSIGMAISNILEFSGNKIVKANLVNDRGIHICKSMLAYQKWKKGSPDKKSDHFVGDCYVLFEKNKSDELEKEALEMLQKWESGDSKTVELWKKMNQWAVTGMKETYRLFGSRFDVWFFESEFYKNAKPIIDDGLKKNIFQKDEEGRIIAKLENHGLPDKVVLRSDGTSIYISNDLALTKHKFEHFHLDRAIWIVASEQNLYFKQLFKIFELIGYEWDCHHLSYGMVHLPSGRMKSREGTVIDADDLIADVMKLAREEIEKRHHDLGEEDIKERARQIALSAIKYYLLKVEPIKDLLFEAEKAISFEGDTGPYIQYTYARANSILNKSEKEPEIKALGKSEFLLIKKLSVFPEIIEKCARELKPNYLTNYLFELATIFNEYYHNERVIGSEKEEARLALVKAVKTILKKGLELLNIEAPDEM